MISYTDSEINQIKKSCDIVSNTISIVASELRLGLKLCDIDRLAETYIRDSGGIPAFKGYMGFPCSLCISVNDVVIHGIPNDYIIKENDVIGIDCGVVYEGFYGDSAYTFMMDGDVDYGFLIKVTRDALSCGISNALFSKRTEDIGYAIDNCISSNNLGNIISYSGHGVGRNLHEPPRVPNYGRPNMGDFLGIGTVIAIEPMVSMGGSNVHIKPDMWSVATMDGSITSHFEHTVAITKNGTVVLSNHDIVDNNVVKNKNLKISK